MYARSTRSSSTHFAALVVGLGLVIGSSLATAQLPAKVGDTPVPSLAPMIKKASPAVVNIATKGTVREQGGAGGHNPLMDDPFFRRFFDIPEGPRERQFQSAGSGVIVDAKNGYVLTNAHVVENASEITVTLFDNRNIKAQLVGSDKESDIAVLKLKGASLTEMPFADSSKAEVGDFVVAIGNPFGLQHTVTSGIISALGRANINPDNRDNALEDFIQTDAAINPGNSGGALVNLSGQLVGINSAILSQSGGNIGIGFAIPSNMAKSVMDQLIKYGEVKRGLLGVQIRALTPALAESYGVPADTAGALVAGVNPGSPAEKAGIELNDIVIAVNGKAIKNSAELRNTIGLMRVGDKVDLTILRDGKQRHINASVGDRDKGSMTTKDSGDAPSEMQSGLEGAELVNTDDNKGVLVRSVKPGSEAAENGLRPNDIIMAVGRTRVNNLDQLRSAITNKDAFGLRIKRGNVESVIVIE
jgi:Do/DeqQ family serine protease